MYGVIFSAGFGTRFQPWTHSLPKPSIPFLNVPQIGYSLYWLDALGIKKIGINTHHLPEQIRHSTQQLCPRGIDIKLFHESPHILGSSGGLENMSSFLRNSKKVIITFNGDTIHAFPQVEALRNALDSHIHRGNLVTLIGMHHPLIGKGHSGLWVNDQYQLKSVGPHPTREGHSGFYYTGVAFLHPRFLTLLKPGFSHIFSDYWIPLSQQGEKIVVAPIEGQWGQETGNIQGYLAATEKALKHLKSNSPLGKSLWSIIQKYSPQSQLIPPAKILPSASPRSLFLIEGEIELLKTPSQINGFLVASNGAKIDTNQPIQNLVLGPFSHLNSSSTHKDSLLLT